MYLQHNIHMTQLAAEYTKLSEVEYLLLLFQFLF